MDNDFYRAAINREDWDLAEQALVSPNDRAGLNWSRILGAALIGLPIAFLILLYVGAR